MFGVCIYSWTRKVSEFEDISDCIFEIPIYKSVPLDY